MLCCIDLTQNKTGHALAHWHTREDGARVVRT
ncbi:MAG: hypothetical protein RI925_1195 [Pseudomonadota bacterium]|jgi:hypothetical protein